MNKLEETLFKPQLTEVDGKSVLYLGDGLFRFSEGRGRRSVLREELQLIKRFHKINANGEGKIEYDQGRLTLYDASNKTFDLTEDPDFNFSFFFPEVYEMMGGEAAKPHKTSRWNKTVALIGVSCLFQ